jgi:hypothetical protein
VNNHYRTIELARYRTYELEQSTRYAWQVKEALEARHSNAKTPVRKEVLEARRVFRFGPLIVAW